MVLDRLKNFFWLFYKYSPISFEAEDEKIIMQVKIFIIKRRYKIPYAMKETEQKILKKIKKMFKNKSQKDISIDTIV